MYKKILSINSQAAASASGGGLNKAENATSTITLKDLKTPSPVTTANNVHHHQPQQTNARAESPVVDDDDDADVNVNVNDENAPSNFTIESAVNSSDKVICENTYELPLASSIQTSSPSHHVSSSSPTPPSKMEPGDYSSEHTYPTHKSIHHTTTSHYRDMMADENLENKQQNFVNEEDDVWRPW
jgi:hypothetical protein